MTIQGAISELVNLLNADDVPIYYKSGLKKVIETIDDYIDGKDDYVKRRVDRKTESDHAKSFENTPEIKRCSKDTIYRQDAIDKFEPWLNVSGYSEGELNMLKAVLYELRFLPSAEPDKGEWLEKEVIHKDDEVGSVIEEWQCARCSVCGKYHTTPHMYYFAAFPFCPMCGADMRGAGDEVD